LDTIVSEVDRDNTAMIAVNRKLGIPRVAHPARPTESWLCTRKVK
jgi:RimJ/RimL family protein N-acetyltransferase